MVLEGLQREQFPRLTFDFDGSVQSTQGHAEGTAVGFNKSKKGARSYYDLFCTVAQTGQFFDLSCIGREMSMIPMERSSSCGPVLPKPERC